MSRRPLWACIECGREFANRNQSHACAVYTVEEHLRGKPPEICALFAQFVSVLQSIGPVRVIAEKTRVAFQVRMSFAQLTLRRRWIDGHIVLARRVESPRFRRVETLSPRNHLHAFRINDVAELDSEFRAWLAEAYAVGNQEHLSSPAARRHPRSDAEE